MERNPVHAKYNSAVRNILVELLETLDLPSGEFDAQEREWVKGVEEKVFNSADLSRLLRSKINDGYKARIISIVLAPKGLLPFTWKEEIPDIDIDAETAHFSERLRDFISKLRELNTIFETACV